MRLHNCTGICVARAYCCFKYAEADREVVQPLDGVRKNIVHTAASLATEQFHLAQQICRQENGPPPAMVGPLLTAIATDYLALYQG